MFIIDLTLPLVGLLVMLDVLRYLDKNDEVKFMNTILDLNVEKKYIFKDVKSIFAHACNLNVNIDDLSEYNIKRIQKLINNIEGNLLKSDTRYYDNSIIIGGLIKIFGRYKDYKNNKNELLNLLSNVLKELDEEKKFFGLNKREKEIFLDLNHNKNLSDSDIQSILELKDIIVNRYQELMKRNEQSDRLSKISIKLGYISLIITAIGFYMSYFNTHV